MKHALTGSAGALALALALGPAEAHAAGFEVCERSDQLTSMACVGKAVGIGHPDAAGNPATLAAFDDPTVAVGVRLIGINSRFEEAAPGPQGGGDGGDAGPLLPLPSFHASMPVSERMRIGLSVGAPFGLELAYDQGWAGRYFVQEISFQTISATFGAAYRVSPEFDVGIGVSAQYGKGFVRRAVNNVLDGLADGQFDLEGDGVALGWNAGAIWRPDGAPIEIGIAYRSGLAQKLEGEASAEGIGPTLASFGVTDSGAELSFDLPQQLSFEAAFRLSERTRLIAQAEWSDWSAFEETRVRLDNGFIENAERGWRGAYRFGLAAEHRLNENWLLRGGVSYETSAVSDSLRRPDIPTDVQRGYAIGADRRLGDRFALNFSAAWFDLGDNSTDVAGPLEGVLGGAFDQQAFFAGIGATTRF